MDVQPLPKLNLEELIDKYTDKVAALDKELLEYRSRIEYDKEKSNLISRRMVAFENFIDELKTLKELFEEAKEEEKDHSYKMGLKKGRELITDFIEEKFGQL